MAFQDLIAELRGAVPKVPISYLPKLVNRAWREVRESQLWSFNLFESSWLTPPLINSGTVTTTQGSTIVTFDVAAIAAISTGSTLYSLITQRQFRIGVGGIYNLISLDPSFSVNGNATLDRTYLDPGGPGQSYQIYQLYYTPPMSDFLVWLSVRNPAMFIDLDLSKTRQWIDARDPQRAWYQFPTHVVPFGRDSRGAGTPTPSSTLGYPLFELWGQPISNFTYQCYGLRRGTDLVAPTDTLPLPVGDDLVLAKARAYVYEWAEANKDQQPRSQGPDFRFLIGQSNEEYKRLLVLYRKQDRELINNYFSVREPTLGALAYGFYNTLSSTAGPYTQL